MSHYEFGTCPACSQRVMLSQADYRSVLSHSAHREHREGCPARGSKKGKAISGCTCGYAVYKDGRACKGAGRVAVEKRKQRGQQGIQMFPADTLVVLEGGGGSGGSEEGER